MKRNYRDLRLILTPGMRKLQVEKKTSKNSYELLLFRERLLKKLKCSREKKPNMLR